MGRQHFPPADFDADHVEVWLVAQRALREQGTWQKSDGLLLEHFCRNAVAARRARHEAQDCYDALKLGVLLKRCATAEAAMLAIARELLLTPASRRRAGVKAPGTAVEDELQALIA